MGGQARAAKLSKEERSSIAQKAASARWKLPAASHEGTLKIGDAEFTCAVIEADGKPPIRVISQTEFMRGLGMYYSGFIAKQHKESGAAELPQFMAQKALKPFIEKNLSVLQFEPFQYRTIRGTAAKGIPAEIIPKICSVWIEADRAGVLGVRQKQIAEKAFMIHSALAQTGIVALVDEVTGYQGVRARDALQLILDAYLRKEFAAWAKRFPDEFYREIYRLRGWQWPGMQKNRFPLVGKLTKDIVYERLAPAVLQELERLNPKDEKGHRKGKHHQLFTEDVGHPALAQHLHASLGLMRACETYPQFKMMLDRAFPKKGTSVQLELLPDVSKSTSGATFG